MRIKKSLLLAAAATAAAMTLAPPNTARAQTAPDTRTPPLAATNSTPSDGLSSWFLPPPPPPPPPPSYIDRNAYIGFGPAYYGAKGEDGGDTINCYGLAVHGGVTLYRTNVGQIRLGGDMGAYFGSKSYPGEWESGKVTLNVFDVMFTPAYEFNLGAPNYRLRLGPVFGATVLMEEDKYEDLTFKGSGVSFSYGLEVGFTWTPSKSFFVDLGYRFTKNSAEMGGDFEDFLDSKLKWAGHRVALSVGWRF